jgi:hypothetical protein
MFWKTQNLMISAGTALPLPGPAERRLEPGRNTEAAGYVNIPDQGIPVRLAAGLNRRCTSRFAG